jgi:hypothetical protein
MRSGSATGQMARLGRDDADPAPLQRGQVLADRGVLPHFGVHGRAQHHRGPGGQQGGGQQVVGETGGVARHEVRRGRHDQDQIGTLTQTGVRNGAVLIPQRALDRLGGQGGEGHLAHEAGRLGGQDGHHVRAGVHQSTADLDGLVSRDAAADTQNNPGPGLP